MTNGPRALLKIELIYARRQGNAEYIRQTALPKLPTEDLDIGETKINNIPSLEESTIFIVLNEAKEITQPIPLTIARTTEAEKAQTTTR